MTEAVERVRSMCEDDETLLSVVRVSETDQGDYYLATRTWPHREEPGLHVVSIRYAYLTKGGGSDGWVDNGVNIRVEAEMEPADLLRSLARTFASSIPRLDGAGTVHYDDLLEQ